MSNVPDGIQYTKEHEWAKVEGNKVTVGITAKVGDTVTAGKAFGTIESVKTLSDLYAPVAGKIVAINGDLTDKPELVNEDCYGKAWMVTFEVSGPVSGLLDANAYREFLKTAG